MQNRKQQIPWAMAAGRALLGPVLVAGELSGWNGLAMAWLVLTALVSDIFDGVLARHWHCDTAGVRLFDSMADTAFYVCVAVALWIGQPQLLRGNAGLLAALLALEAVRFGVDFAKFGKPASYHSWLAKAWGLAMGIAVIAVLLSPHAGALLAASFALGIACNLEGLAMSLVLPIWRKDVKGLRAAMRLRREMLGAAGKARGNRWWVQPARKAGIAAALTLCLAMPALAIEPGQAAYAGGTAGLALDTPGTLDTTSAAALVFKAGAAEIAIPYTKVRTVEVRNDVVRHLGFLPALGAGLVAARQRRYTLTIGYADANDAVQVATFQTTERDQLTLQAVLRARSPRSCAVTQYNNTCPVRPVTAPAAAAK
jgi:CDP-diacylglycerol--glycerol-3-phosphate 3-phosphatidyltransferase